MSNKKEWKLDDETQRYFLDDEDDFEAYSEPTYYFDEKEGIYNLKYYVEKAEDHLGSITDRDLSLRLGLAQNAVHLWLKGKSFPTDLNMVKIATFAKEDAQEAVMHLHYWKADNDLTRRVYKELILKLRGVASLLIFAALTFVSSPSRAGIMQEHKQPNLSKIYIITQLSRNMGLCQRPAEN